MNDPNLNLLEAAVKLLEPLLDELVFVGGCTTGLLISDAAAGGIRVTKDVDTITEISSYAEYATLSERLRALGLVEDHSEDAPTCRWRCQDLIIDVMPTDERILGFSNQWYTPAIASAQDIQIAGVRVRAITSIYFLATKLEAFRGRTTTTIAAAMISRTSLWWSTAVRRSSTKYTTPRPTSDVISHPK
jgi:hypothetical protein